MRQFLQAARSDDFGQHHSHGEEGFFLLLGILAARAVLHDKHANGVAGTKHGHAEEGVVNLFAGFGQIFERRMRLRVGQIERFGTGGDGADKAFAHFQFGFMNGFALQAFRRVKFQHLAFAHDIDRADLGHHDGRDESDDLV